MNTPLVRAAIGAALIGVGLAFMLSAARSVAGACEDCEEDAIESIEAVAHASAEMEETDE